MFQIQWRKKVLMETFLTWKSLWSVLSLAEPRFFDATDRPLPAAWKKIDKKLFLEFEKDNGDDIAEQKIEFHSWKENECKLCEREIAFVFLITFNTHCVQDKNDEFGSRNLQS